MEKGTLIIHKTCEVYSLWFFEELRELIGISRGVHLDLSNGVSTTVCGVFLIERSWVPFRCWVSLFLMGFTSLSTSLNFFARALVTGPIGT